MSIQSAVLLKTITPKMRATGNEDFGGYCLCLIIFGLLLPMFGRNDRQ
ncbi:hypothetical protein MNB_SUP05-SYMBIONT-4-484 [hydrothermal vent metagenome]|uniref:Uncharacterized protein n=1 Tax=hydrothermal vent metagenome TaxID=652676 RepID=A0A1W1DYT2_9ZZZZ